MGHPNAQPSLPRWFQIGLSASAVIQVIGGVVFVFGPPVGWSSILGLPVAAAQAAMGLGVLILCLLAAAAWQSPPPRFLSGSYRWLTRMGQRRAVWLIPLLLVIPLYLTIAANWIGLWLVAFQIWLIGAILHRIGADAQETGSDSWLPMAAGVALAIGLGLRVWLLLTGAFPDEGSLVNAVTNMVETGHIASKGIRLPDTAPNRPEWGRLLIVYGWWGRLFGVGAEQVRALGLLLGLGALAAQAAMVRLWYGKRAAWMGSGLAVLGWLGMQSVAGRNNALPMLAFGLVLWLHIDAVINQRAAWRHALIGLLAALSLETHLANLALLAALGGYYALDYLEETIRQHKPLIRLAPLWLYLGGALPGLLLYLYLHVFSLPDPGAYINHMMAHTGESAGLLAAIGNRLAGIIPAYSELWLVSPFEVLLLILTIAAAIWRRTVSDRHWLYLLLSYELGYLIVRSQFIVNLGYAAMAAPLLYAGLGPLITQGFGRTPDVSPRWRAPLVAGLVVGLAAYSVEGIGASRAVREEIEAVALPAEAVLHEYVEPGQVIVGTDFYYPYLTEYEYLFPTWWRPTKLSSALAGQPKEAYWLEVYLETWPRADVRTYHADAADGDESEEPLRSYLQARHAFTPIDYVWIVPDDGLITDAPYATPTGAALQMVGHVPLPDGMRPGVAFTLHTIWVTRGSIAPDMRATLAAVDAAGQTLELDQHPLVGGWSGTTTGAWEAYRFYDVAFEAAIPADAEPGAYTLRLSLSPDGPEAACQPGCVFEVGTLTVGGQ